MPVTTGAGQPRHLDTQHQSNATQPNLSHQPLEARPVYCRGARATQIVIDHLNPLACPAQLQRSLHQRVLQPRRLLMLLDLAQRRLPHVNDRQPVLVASLDLLREHHPVPPHLPDSGHCRPPSALDAGSAGGRRGDRAPRRAAVGSPPAVSSKAGPPSEAAASWCRVSHRTRPSNAARPSRGCSVVELCPTDVSTMVDGTPVTAVRGRKLARNLELLDHPETA